MHTALSALRCERLKSRPSLLALLLTLHLSCKLFLQYQKGIYDLQVADTFSHKHKCRCSATRLRSAQLTSYFLAQSS